MNQFICDSRGVHEIMGSTGRNPDPWLIGAFGGGESESGIRVTPKKILSHVPIWQGVNIISGDAAMLPKMLKRRLNDGGTQDNTTHVAYRLVAQRANPLMSAQTFWETILMHAIVYGNGVAEIARDGAGRPDLQQGMTPLLPEHTQPEYDESGRLWIKTKVPVAGPRGRHQQLEERFIDPRDTVQIKGLAGDGIWGFSLREVAQDAIGYGLALRKHGNTTFKNRARPDVILRHPDTLSEPAWQRFMDSWNAMHQGLDNVARAALLEDGADAVPFGQNNEDAQWIDAQKLDREFVASLLNIPAHMLNALERATFSNIEEQSRWYVNRTLNRWLEKIHWECWEKLLTRREQERMFFKTDLDMLLIGTLKDRAEAYNSLRAAKIINANEAREKEGMNPYEGGDEYENPNTSTTPSPNDSDDSVDVENRLRQVEERNAKLLADRLFGAIHHEDEEIKRAALREKNFINWVSEFYRTTLSNRLCDLVSPDVAANYCDDRLEYWLDVSGKVQRSEELADTAKMQDQRLRRKMLLNMEINPNGHARAA